MCSWRAPTGAFTSSLRASLCPSNQRFVAPPRFFIAEPRIARPRASSLGFDKARSAPKMNRNAIGKPHAALQGTIPQAARPRPNICHQERVQGRCGLNPRNMEEIQRAPAGSPELAGVRHPSRVRRTACANPALALARPPRSGRPELRKDVAVALIVREEATPPRAASRCRMRQTRQPHQRRAFLRFLRRRLCNASSARWLYRPLSPRCAARPPQGDPCAFQLDAGNGRGRVTPPIAARS